MNEHHYYGSTAYDWVVGKTREEVIKKLAQGTGSHLIRRAVKTSGGLQVVTCRVDAPIDAPYRIEDYLPRGVPTAEVEKARITSVRGATVPRVD